MTARPALPKVSILIPAHQAESTLATCMKSVLRQRERDWECVIVDDGSSDGTVATAQEFARLDARVRVLACEHRGIVGALTEGLAECRGTYVARMDADDWMHRDRLGAQLDVLDASPALAGVGSHVRIFPRAGLTDGRRAYERWLNGIAGADDVRREAFVECPIAHPTWLLRRDVLRGLAWRDAGWAEDYDLLLRLLAAGHSLSVVPRRLLAWRDTPERLSRVAAAYSAERFTACKAAFLADGLLKGRDTYVLWGYGDTGRALRRALLRHEKRPSHIVELHPGRLGQRIHGAPVVAPGALKELPGHRVLASVAGADARGRIRAALDAMGFRETRDYVCCS